MNIVYLNGEFLPKAQAKISIFDRGFLFGDGVYEVIPVFNGQAFQALEHLVRLKKSLAAVRIPGVLTETEWFKIFKELMQRNNIQNATFNIYLQVTRGAEETRSQAIPEKITPTVLAFCVPVKEHTRQDIAAGFSAITLDDSRRLHGHIKATALLPSILLYDEARKTNAVDAILVRNGEVTEGTLSNVFMVKDNILMTPPENHTLLSGVTRQLIIQIAKENNITLKEIKITPAMLKTADEIWLTGSSKEICPVVKLDGQVVGKGVAGPLWHRMFDLYEACKKNNKAAVSLTKP